MKSSTISALAFSFLLAVFVHQVIAEDPVTGKRIHTNTAYVVYVALDEARNPRAVPGLLVETEAEALQMEEGQRRQAHRLAQRAQESQRENR